MKRAQQVTFYCVIEYFFLLSYYRNPSPDMIVIMSQAEIFWLEDFIALMQNLTILISEVNYLLQKHFGNRTWVLNKNMMHRSI